jgi:hypothetical protein
MADMMTGGAIGQRDAHSRLSSLSDPFDIFGNDSTPLQINQKVLDASKALEGTPQAAKAAPIEEEQPQAKQKPLSLVEKVQQAAQDPLEGMREQFAVPVSEIQWNIISRAAAESENPEEELSRYAAALTFSREYGISMDAAYSNLDDLSKNLTGKPYSPNATGFQAISNSFKAGRLNMQFSDLAYDFKQADLKGEDTSALLSQLDAMGNEIAGLKDHQSRNVLTTVLKWTAEGAVPYMMEVGKSALAGATFAGALGTGFTAATGVTLGSLAAASPYTLAAIIGMGAAVGAVNRTRELMEGASYLQLRQMGVDKDIANVGSRTYGLIVGAIETGLGIEAGTIIKAVGGSNLVTSASSKVMAKMIASGKLGTLVKGLAALGANATGEAVEEMIEEPLDYMTRHISYAIQDSREPGSMDPLPDENLVRNTLEAGLRGFASAIVLGGLPAILDGKMNLDKQAKIRREAAAVPSKEAFVASMKQQKPDTVTTADWTGAMSEIWEKEHSGKADSTAIQSDEAAIAELDIEKARTQPQGEVRRLKDGNLYTQEASETSISPDGTEQRRMLVGDPATSSRYGYIDYGIKDNTITIEDVLVKSGYESIRKEAVLSLARQYPGYDIQWEPKSDALSSVRDEILSSNPRGKEAGLQYWDGITDVDDRIMIERQIEKAMPNLSAPERALGATLVQLRAEAAGMNTQAYLDASYKDGKLFGDTENLAVNMQGKRGAVAFDEDLKAIIYAGQKADFSTFAHETFHVSLRQMGQLDQFKASVAEASQKPEFITWLDEHAELFADSVFEGKNAQDLADIAAGFTIEDWGRTQEEFAARLYEGYLADGKTASSKLKQLFNQIAKWMAQIYTTLKHSVDLDPRIIEVFDSLSDKQSPLAKQLVTQESNSGQMKSEALYQGDEGFMKAPNGKPTNLTEKQWKQVRTPEFIKWFGDWMNDPKNASKVVDENGEPLVVYHGTENEFTQYDFDYKGTGGWSRLSVGYANAKNEIYLTSSLSHAEAYGQYVMPLFTRIINPLKNNAKRVLESWRKEELKQYPTVQKMIDEYYEGDVYNAIDADGYFQNLAIEAKLKGKDGVIVDFGDLKHKSIGTLGKVIIVFSPTQIKSATSNIGTFDVENPNILFQEDGKPRISNDYPARPTIDPKNWDFKKTSEQMSEWKNKLREWVDKQGDILQFGDESLVHVVHKNVIPDELPWRSTTFINGEHGWVPFGHADYDTKYKAVLDNVGGKAYRPDILFQEDMVQTLEEAQRIDKDSFMHSTEATFSKAKRPNREPDYTSRSGSMYWYEDEGVYRESDHWGKGVASTNWYLKGQSKKQLAENYTGGIAVGFAKFSAFKRLIVEAGSTPSFDGTGIGYYKRGWDDVTVILDPEATGPSSYMNMYKQAGLYAKYNGMRRALGLGKDILFQDDLSPADFILEEARGFDSWQEWKAFYESFDDPYSPSPKTDDSWYEEMYNKAHSITSEQEAQQVEEAKAKLQTEQEKDQYMIDQLSTDSGVRAFVEKLGWMLSNRSLKESEGDMQAAEAILRMQQTAQGLVHPTIFSNAQRAAGGSKISDRAVKSIRTLMTGDALRYYRDIYADVMEDPTLKPQVIDSRLPGIDDPGYRELERLSISERLKLGNRIQADELRKPLLSGKETFKGATEIYIKDRELQIKELNEQVSDLERQIADMEKKLTSEQQTRIMVAVTYMDDQKKLDAELKKLQKLNNEGKAAPKGYADSALSTQAKLDKLHEEVIQMRKDARMDATIKKYEAVAKLKEQIAAKKAEKAEAMKIREYKAALARKIMVKPSDAINYEQAQAMYGIQALIDPNFRREGINVAMFGGKATLTAEEAKGYLASAFAEGSTEDEIIDAIGKRNYERLVEQRKPLNDWTIEELEELANEMAELRYEGRRILEAKRERQNVIAQQYQDAIIRSLIATGKYTERPIVGTREDQEEKTSPKRTVLAARYATLPMRAKAMMLDGDTQGAAYNLLVLQKRAAQAKEWVATENRMKPVMQAMKDAGVTEKDLYKTVSVALEPGKSINMTYSSLMYAYLSQYEDSNKAAVAYGNLVTQDEKAQLSHDNKLIKSLGQSRYKALIDQAGFLLSEDDGKYMKVLDAVRKDFNGQKERINEIAIREFNQPMRAVEEYLPIHRREFSGEDMSQQVADDIFNQNAGGLPTGVQKGFTKDRIAISADHQRPIDLDLMQVWNRSVRQQEHFIAFAEYGRKLNRVFKNPGASDVKNVIIRTLGQEMLDDINDYIGDVVNPVREAKLKKMESAVRFMRGNLGAAYLTFKMSGLVLQAITSPFPFLPEIGPAYFAKGYFELFADPTALNRIYELSPMMKNRTMNVIIDQILQQSRTYTQSSVQRGLFKMQEIGSIGLTMVDRYAVAGGWLGAYHQRLDRLTAEGLDTAKAQQMAVVYADDITLKTQPTGDATEIAPLFTTGSEFTKAFTQFTTSMNPIWTNLTYDFPVSIKRKEFAKAVGRIVSYGMAGAILGAVAEGFDDDDDEIDKLRKWIYWSFTQGTGSIPLIGDQVDEVIKSAVTGDKPVFFADEFFPGMSKVLKGVGNLTQGEFLKALENLGKGAGYMAGLPVSGIQQVIDATQEGPQVLLGR